ncbi:MAG: hypothetical protein A2848_03525 [Candidatus Magasanikbacteria bacterium RIFCSPHIGHO2_01_FULL_50_8]|uniref:RNA polymerase alpha subunit C-terminal domain-containing protein n=2 Tax=Candidatus Magasanikiibacteriota TaxID=1752731 RepID=A0A1F6LSG7_9BACT|nr:MAG: hypothetical protein A2848_03525 [Candidatus Magasanikbacteria bacterium RIFCSPHIGHO2_01_FULL_50_8]OGH68020.1 MAG: hypothetical protein A3C15_00485 [Candidatus Magasanikbacteria bacterium RIFCSPHIGHO2_02_FULL_50_9b]
MGSMTNQFMSDLRQAYGVHASDLNPFLWEHVRKAAPVLVRFSDKSSESVRRSMHEECQSFEQMDELLKSGSLIQVLLVVEAHGFAPQDLFLPNLEGELHSAACERIRKLHRKYGRAALLNRLKGGCPKCGFVHGDKFPKAKFCVECGEALKGWSVAPAADETAQMHHILNRTIDSLELSVRTANAIKNAVGGLESTTKYVGELVVIHEEELLKMWNFGPKSHKDLNDALDQLGLRLGMTAEDLKGWQKPDE